MTPPFKQAICSEIYEKWPLRDACRSMRRIGYSGIEISPFTLAERPGDISSGKGREYRDVIQCEGLSFVGLHWLMVASKGLDVTTPEHDLRERSWRHIVDLIDLCGDLGENGVMVFGSPKQRCTVDGLTPVEASRNFTTGLAGVAPHAAQRGVTVLVEALPLNQCDVITMLAEAVATVNQVNSPAVRTMFDTHNAIDESESHASLVDRYFDLIRHVHMNEVDIRDFEGVAAAVSGADVVFHLAAIPSVPRSIHDPVPSHEVNMNGTFNVFRACAEAKVRRVVYSASSSAYGDTEVLPKVETMLPRPKSPYAVQKLTGEYYASAFHSCFGLETVSLRFFNVYGERQDPSSQYSGVLSLFMRALI